MLLPMKEVSLTFEPRDYQIPLCDALENKKFRRLIAIWPRRAGKDITALNLCIRQAFREVCVIFYIFPTYAQGKKVIFDSVTNTGKRLLDFVPRELIESINTQEMKIRLVNGSLIQVVGSDNYDRLMGTGPRGLVFSEYSLQDPRAYQYLRPILTANNGWAIFISTPRGKNHLYDMYNSVKDSPYWWTEKLTVEDTNHIPLSEIQREKEDGLMSDDLIQQEYYTSFTMGICGNYFGRYLDDLRFKQQIGLVPYEPSFPVNSSWDLGIRDNTSIIMWQNIGGTVRIIDCYENSKHGLEHYVNVLKEKGYIYGKHIAPHDIKVTEFGSGITRLEKARQLGIRFTLSGDYSIEDGIEAVRSNLPRCYFDAIKCEPLLKALENYRQEYDQKHRVYKSQPLHNWASHFADSMRYLCVSLPKTRDSMSAQDLESLRNEVFYGSDQSNLPPVFRTDLPSY